MVLEIIAWQVDNGNTKDTNWTLRMKLARVMIWRLLLLNLTAISSFSTFSSLPLFPLPSPRWLYERLNSSAVLPWEEGKRPDSPEVHNHDTLLTITMSTERPSKRIRKDSAARSFNSRPSDLSFTSAPSSMAVDLNRDNDTIGVDTGTTWVTSDTQLLLLIFILLSNLALEMTPIVDIHHASATTIASTEAYVMSPPVSVSVSTLIPSVSRQLGSSSISVPECPSTVSSHLALANCRD